jgi:hypothetical protein
MSVETLHKAAIDYNLRKELTAKQVENYNHMSDDLGRLNKVFEGATKEESLERCKFFAGLPPEKQDLIRFIPDNDPTVIKLFSEDFKMFQRIFTEGVDGKTAQETTQNIEKRKTGLKKQFNYESKSKRKLPKIQTSSLMESSDSREPSPTNILSAIKKGREEKRGLSNSI